MVVKVEAAELRTLSDEELAAALKNCEEEYQRFLQQRYSHTAERADVTLARKNIARCKYVMKERQIKMAVEEFKGSKYLPKELRPKLNKALRMRLTRDQRNKKTLSQRIHKSKYPKKVFAFTE